MNFPLYEDVILQVDLPEEGVLAGYSVEFFNMSGDTVAVVVVAGSKLRHPVAIDRPMVRQFYAQRTASPVPLAA